MLTRIVNAREAFLEVVAAGERAKDSVRLGAMKKSFVGASPMKNVHSAIDNAATTRHSLLAVPLLLARQLRLRHDQTLDWRHHNGCKEEDHQEVREEVQEIRTEKSQKSCEENGPEKEGCEKEERVKRKPNAAFMKPMTPTATLAAVIGGSPLPRTEVTKKLWAYIKRNGLQDSKNRRNINADDKLQDVFGGKKQVSMFEMTKLVSRHLK